METCTYRGLYRLLSGCLEGCVAACEPVQMYGVQGRGSEHRAAAARCERPQTTGLKLSCWLVVYELISRSKPAVFYSG